jgi:hypothetical protein
LEGREEGRKMIWNQLGVNSRTKTERRKGSNGNEMKDLKADIEIYVL